MKKPTHCFVCGEDSKRRITRLVENNLFLDICDECERRIDRGEDCDYDNYYQALFDLGQPVDHPVGG